MTEKERKILNVLGLAHRARKLVTGDFAVETALKNNKAALIISAANASERTAEKYRQLAKKHNIPLLTAGDKEDLAQAVGKDGQTAVVALTDAGFVRAVTKLTANC